MKHDLDPKKYDAFVKKEKAFSYAEGRQKSIDEINKLAELVDQKGKELEAQANLFVAVMGEKDKKIAELEEALKKEKDYSAAVLAESGARIASLNEIVAHLQKTLEKRAVSPYSVPSTPSAPYAPYVSPGGVAKVWKGKIV